MLGAVCGDILGSSFEFERKKYFDLSAIKLMNEDDQPTDDTAMTVAVADWLLHDIDGVEDEAQLKLSLSKRFVEYAFNKFGNLGLGFGAKFWRWLCKGHLAGEFEPYNSFGNGSGMRVSPIGWYFDTIEETLYFARLSAEVSHNHPEGVKGAVCIAAAVFWARQGKSKKQIRSLLYDAFKYEILNKSILEVRQECKWSSVCQDTVPMAVLAFLESEDFSSAIKLSVSYGSDSDTIAAMAGAIAQAYYREIPQDMQDFCRSKLPESVADVCDEFESKIIINR